MQARYPGRRRMRGAGRQMRHSEDTTRRTYRVSTSGPWVPGTEDTADVSTSGPWVPGTEDTADVSTSADACRMGSTMSRMLAMTLAAHASRSHKAVSWQ